MSWSSSVEDCGNSITKLFGHLCSLHCRPNRVVCLSQPRQSKSHRLKKFLRRLYETLFEFHLGDLKYLDSFVMYRTMSPDLWMFEYIYNLRCTRNFDKGDKLEKLYNQLMSESSVDLSDIDSILTVILLLADTQQTQQQKLLGHQEQRIPITQLKDNVYHLLPKGPSNYNDTCIYKPHSSYYMHYPSSVFESEPLTDLGYLSMDSSSLEDLEQKSSGSLFGSLVQECYMSLNDKLELPDFPEDGRMLEIHIPQKRQTTYTPDMLDVSVASSGFISDVQQRCSTAHWDQCLDIKQSQFFTWDRRGWRGPTDKPYLTELGPRVVQEWCRIKRRELAILCPDVPQTHVRRLTSTEVIKDLLHLMIGIPSSVFLINKETQTFHLSDDCEVYGFTQEAFGNFSADFISCGTRYCRLRAFCASTTVYNGGLIFQAFLVAMNRVLHHYAAVILSIQSSMNILELKFLCHKLFDQMRYLSFLCHCEQTVSMEQLKQFPKGVSLLSYLYKETADSTNTDNYLMMLSILQTSCGPYNLFVQEWVYHGVLRDSYGEFLIRVNENYLRFKDKHYWTHSYTMINRENSFVPGFLDDFANDIFICGKTLNLLKACCPRHFLCGVRELDIPRISLTFSEDELMSVTTQCQIYVSKMQQIARQQESSRQALEQQAEQRKIDLLRRAKAVAVNELQRIQDQIVKRKQLADTEKRKQFIFLKEQMELDLQRRSQAVEDEKEEDRLRMEKLTMHERLMTEKEKELEAEAREEIINYYASLTKEAAEREEKAMWKIRRAVLQDARYNFLKEDEQAWEEEMEKYPEGVKIERAVWEVEKSESKDDAYLPKWARRIMAKPPLENKTSTPSMQEADLPSWASKRLSSLRVSESSENEVFRSPVKHNVNKESEESLAKPSIQVFPEFHPSKESTSSSEQRKQIHVRSDQHPSKESDPLSAMKPGVKLATSMNATKETEAEQYRPHLKASVDRFSTKESTETKEVSFPKLKAPVGMGISKETEAKEWKVKTASAFGHISQMSRQTQEINVPRLKRPEEIHASLQSDYKDYGIKPRIRMNKKMYASKESEIILKAPRTGIKFSEVMSSVKESEWIDFDKRRLEKFKQMNIHGHASDSTVQSLLYKDVSDKEVEHEPEIPPIQWTTSQWPEPFRYQDNFDICNEPPAVDILLASSHRMTYGGLGDYGISQMTDVDVVHYLPLDEIMRRSVVAPLLAQISLVNESVLNYYFLDLHLSDHLEALRRYLLMEDGEFAQIFSDMLFEKLSTNLSPTEMLNPLFLNGALSKAIKSSTHTDDKLSENLSFAVRFQPGHPIKPGHSVLDCLELRYTVPWPLNIVITDDSVSEYNEIFSFMLLLKQTVWVLKDVWHRLKRAALIHKAGNASQFRRLQLYRQEMQHFVRVMQSYIAHQVIFVTWNEFQAALKSDLHNLDDLIRIHRNYLNKAIFRCLLNAKAAKIMKIIRDMFTLILQFQKLLINADWQKEQQSGEMSHPNFNSMLKYYQNFRQYSVFLFKVISKLVKKGYQSHLQDFLLRLNFNDYYKDN